MKENAFSKPLFVRVNDAMEALGREDIDSISPFQDQIEAIILPKTQSFDFLATLAPMIDFKNKNLKILNKKPLIYWPINALKKSKFVDTVLLSTDSTKIMKI